MKAIMIILALAAGSPTMATAAEPAKAPVATGCAAFNTEIEDQLKKISDGAANSILDDSVPRLSLRQAEMANAWRAIDVNLRLMEAARCPLPKEPLSQSIYLSSAVECVLAKGDDTKTKCKQSTWTRLGAAKPAGQ